MKRVLNSNKVYLLLLGTCYYQVPHVQNKNFRLNFLEYILHAHQHQLHFYMKLFYGRHKNQRNKDLWGSTFSLQSNAVRDHDKHLLHQHPFWRTLLHLIHTVFSKPAGHVVIRLMVSHLFLQWHISLYYIKRCLTFYPGGIQHKLVFVTLSIKAFFITSKRWYFCLVALSRSVQWGPANLPQGPGRNSAVFEAAH